MIDFSIRLAREEDAEHLPAIELAASKLFDTIEGLSHSAGRQALPAAVQRALIRKGHSLVAEADGRIIGFLSTEVHRRELHIREFSVLPEMQRKSVGSVLLRAVEIDARNSGFDALTLTTFADVPWNAPFYARRGFEIVLDVESHPRLHDEIARELEDGLAPNSRCAMIKFLA